MDAQQPQVTILILTYRSCPLVRQNILGIKKLSLPYPYEILVIDSGSTPLDGTVEIIRNSFPDVKVFSFSKNTGYSRGINIGLREAKGEIILILNPDIVFLSDTITPMKDYLLAHKKEVGILGPKLQNPNNTVQYVCRRYTTWLTPFFSRTFLKNTAWGKRQLKHYLMADFSHQETHEVDWIQGSCMMISREMLERVGYQDERLFLYLSDEDWCRRTWENGLKVVYFAEEEAIHYYHRESAAHPWWAGLFYYTSRYHILDWLRYMRKYRRKPFPHRSGN